MKQITLSINNEIHTYQEDISLSDLLSTLKPSSPYAVAVNTTFVPKARYPQTILKNHDKIDIVKPISGG